MSEQLDELLNEVGNVVQASNAQTVASQALAQEVAGKMGEIDSALDAAELQVGVFTTQSQTDIVSMSYGKFYVDQAAGSDSNDGKSGSPLQSIGEAMRRTCNGGYCSVYLKNDYTFSSVESGRNVNLYIRNETGREVTLSFDVYKYVPADIEYRACYGIRFYGLCSFNIYGIEIKLPDYSAMAELPTIYTSSPLRTSSSADCVSLSFKATYCKFNRPSISTPLIFRNSTFVDLILLSVIETGEDMSGYWLNGFAAGSSPALGVRCFPESFTL